jgi:hypothetical protein
VWVHPGLDREYKRCQSENLGRVADSGAGDGLGKGIGRGGAAGVAGGGEKLEKMRLLRGRLTRRDEP